MGLYKIRPPFAVHLAWFDTVPALDGKGTRRVRREKSHFHGEDAVELSDFDAVAHMHKLEPADGAAKALFDGLNERQAAVIAARQPAPSAGVSLAEVRNAVIAELMSTGVIRQSKNVGA